MTTAFKLIAKTLAFQLPPRVLLWGLLNTLNRVFKTGNKRFEFERLYLEHPDPWNYLSSSYEHQKYVRTLARAIIWRNAGGSALEVGCSVGVFSRMLAAHFDAVTAVDVSREALRAAADHNRDLKNVRFVHGDLRSLNLGTRFDVIYCAEILYYIMSKDARRTCLKLDQHLATNGVIVLVSGIPGKEADQFYFDDWEDALAANFQVIFREPVGDPVRPYQIVIFSRRP